MADKDVVEYVRVFNPKPQETKDKVEIQIYRDYCENLESNHCTG